MASAQPTCDFPRVSAKQLPLGGQVKVKAIKEYLQAHTFSWLHNDTLQYNYRRVNTITVIQCRVYLEII